MKRFFDLHALRLAALAGLSVLLLAACGGGAETSENPVTDAPTGGSSYNGPPPATGDIQAFKVSLWENVRGQNRCGNCHFAGGQAPNFARSDDVNLAYQAAQSVVNLSDPSQSRLVTKVGGGHNCWLADNGACADIMTGWIQNWAAFSNSGGGRTIALQAPTAKDPGESKLFPPTPPSGYAAVHTILETHCAGCHTPTSPTQQQPYFAVADPQTSYDAAKSKMNLNSPAQSRFVLRLGAEFHNCWTSNCSNDANAMLAAIQAMADDIDPTAVDTTLALSKALTLFDGTVAAGGNRFDANVIALYEFKTMSGSVAFDTSGVDPAIDLNLTAGVTWVGGWGINIPKGSKAQGLTAASRKLQSRIGLTGEYSIEAWVIPGNVTQEDASIISYSGAMNSRNFALGQTLYNYDFFARSSATGAAGTPALSTADADEDLQAALQHVVVTFSPVNGRRIYVNGQFTGDVDTAGGGSVGSWDDSFALVLGNDAANNRPWTGVVRMLAIHDRVLTPEQITQNFEVGVGQKYFLLFGVSHLVDVSQAYVLFEVSQYDTYSYLFTNPRFISLDPNARPGTIAVRGMRIGINGTEPVVGQAYKTLDKTIADSGYTPAAGFPLSTVGTIIGLGGLETRPDTDEFFLCFDQIGTRSKVCSAEVPAVTVIPPEPGPTSRIGVRTFDEVSATLAKITGVSPTTPAVKQLFDSVRQSLPATGDIEAFLASHQTAVAQLAMQYCNVLASDSTARAAYFTGFDFNGSVAAGSAAALINPTLDHVLGTGTSLSSQPLRSEIQGKLESLVGEMCSPSCSGATRNVQVATAVCAAAAGSAITMIK
ncbi:MAG TPA: LamG domain-containing protein [Steroidobacteraceae bacterium]|nr:LamG domain-containing protein [Steroidobacteraceae bacterium]